MFLVPRSQRLTYLKSITNDRHVRYVKNNLRITTYLGFIVAFICVRYTSPFSRDRHYMYVLHTVWSHNRRVAPLLRGVCDLWHLALQSVSGPSCSPGYEKTNTHTHTYITLYQLTRMHVFRCATLSPLYHAATGLPLPAIHFFCSSVRARMQSVSLVFLPVTL